MKFLSKEAKVVSCISKDLNNISNALEKAIKNSNKFDAMQVKTLVKLLETSMAKLNESHKQLSNMSMQNDIDVKFKQKLQTAYNKLNINVQNAQKWVNINMRANEYMLEMFKNMMIDNIKQVTPYNEDGTLDVKTANKALFQPISKEQV
ncbi:MAG: hypothetical protein AB8B67_04895 [Rickettsiaceae bacterium]